MKNVLLVAVVVLALMTASYFEDKSRDMTKDCVTVIENLEEGIGLLELIVDDLAQENRRLRNRLKRFGIDPNNPVFSKLVTVTVYTSREQETDSSPWTPADGTSVRPGGIGVSRDLFVLLGGFGATVTLKGYGSFTVNDKMNSRYENSVDIWAGDLVAAKRHGRKLNVEMMWQ